MAKSAKKRNTSVVPFYGVAITWLLYSLLFDLYRVGHFIFLAILSSGVFLLLRVVCKPMAAAKTETAAQPKKEESKSTGNPELDKMIKDGELAIAEMKRLDDNIADEKISADIRRLEKTTGKIFAQVKSQPQKLPQIRKFMDYYLPTTLKILNAYDRMDSTGVSGENIDSTKARVEDMMDNIVRAFDKQLDSLFGADALDISTDITVLETMMAREGLTGQPLQADAVQSDPMDIKLEL